MTIDWIDPVLVLSPHTDDGELGAGGAISRWIGEGCTVHYVAFSACEESVPSGFAPDTLRSEAHEATERLGIPPSHCTVLGFSVRRFADKRQEILELMIELREKLRPRCVLVPAWSDVHQDHGVVSQEALRAFKRQTLLGYELPWNCRTFSADLFCPLSTRDLEKKLHALDAYTSQQLRAYFEHDAVEAQLRIRGLQCGHAFAEAFETAQVILSTGETSESP